MDSPLPLGGAPDDPKPKRELRLVDPRADAAEAQAPDGEISELSFLGTGRPPEEPLDPTPHWLATIGASASALAAKAWAAKALEAKAAEREAAEARAAAEEGPPAITPAPDVQVTSAAMDLGAMDLDAVNMGAVRPTKETPETAAPLPAAQAAKAPAPQVEGAEDEYVAPTLEVASWQVPLLDVVGSVTRHLTLVSILLGLGVVKAYFGIKNAEPFYKASSVAILLPREKPILDATVDTGSLETTQDVARRAPSASLTLPPNTDLYVTLLKSYPTLESMADRFLDELVELEGMPTDHRAPERVATIRSMITISGTEDGLLTISVQSKSAQLAADLANALIRESENCSKNIERQLVLQQANFLDEAREKISSIVEEGEESYSAFTRSHGILGVEFDLTQRISQAQQMRKAADVLRGELGAMLKARTPQSSAVQQQKARIKTLEDEADAIYAAIGTGETAEEFGRLQLRRESLEQIVRFRRDLQMTVTAQADIFRIRAEQPTGGMAIVRNAVVPDVPAGPSKKGIVGMAIAASMFLAVLSVIVLEQLALVKRTNALNTRFDAILGNIRHWLPIKIALKCLAVPIRLVRGSIQKVTARLPKASPPAES